MPITITYKLNEPKLKEAIRLANQLLASEDLLRLINTRTTPFDESDPSNLPPSTVAEYVKRSTLALTLCEYTNENPKVGGMFTKKTPDRIHANRNAIPRRAECNLARMLIHECIHALSFNIKEASFSHDDDHPKEEHYETAPYWIQRELKPLCPGIDDVEDIIEVEIIEDSAELQSYDIKCE